jgi:hypothetical protein
MRNLLGRLHERSSRSLAAIASAWEVELRGRDVHQDVARLFNVLTDPWSMSLMLESLTESQQTLLNCLSSHEESATGHEIAELIGTGYDEIREDLRTLYRAGFVFAEQVEAGVDDRGLARLFVPREMIHALQRVRRERGMDDPEHQSLDALLDRLEDTELARIAERHGYTVIPAVARRGQLVEYLQRRLSEPGRLDNFDRGLEWPADALWDWLQATGRTYPSPARKSLRMSMDQFRDALDDLARHGVIWRAYDDAGKVEIIVPDVIRSPSPTPPDPSPELVFLEPASLDVQPLSQPYPAPWDLLTTLRETQAARTQPLARIFSGGADDLSSAAARRLAAMLWTGGDAPPIGYLAFLGALARSLGLVDSSDPPRLTDDVRPWTRLGFQEQQQQIFNIWLDWSEWHEASGRESLQIWGAEWPAFRRLLLADLRSLELAPDQWVTVGSFAERFAAQNPDALGRNFTAALSREHADDRIDSRRADTIRASVELTLVTATRWLGLVDIARSRRHGNAFRLTDTGRWLLDLDPDPPSVDALGDHPISVQPDFEALLLQPSPRTVWTLSGVADLVELDRVSSFELTAASTHRALDSGATVEQITRALEVYAGEPLPENVAFQLREWAAAYRRATIGWALAISVSHAEDIDALQSVLEDAELRVHRTGSDELIVWTESQDRMGSTAARVQQLLRESGLAVRWRTGQ